MEVLRQAERREHPLGRARRLVGAEPDAIAGVERGQGLGDAGIDLRGARVGRLVARLEFGDHRIVRRRVERQPGHREGALDQLDHAPADALPGFLDRQRPPSIAPQRRFEQGLQVGGAVDQGAVEIEDDGGDGQATLLNGRPR